MRLKSTLIVSQETVLLPTTIRRNRPINNQDPVAVEIIMRAPEDPAVNQNEALDPT